MTYTGLQSKQQQQLNNIKNVGKCFFIHLGWGQDAMGVFQLTFFSRECSVCEDIKKCARLLELTEEWMNL